MKSDIAKLYEEFFTVHLRASKSISEKKTKQMHNVYVTLLCFIQYFTSSVFRRAAISTDSTLQCLKSFV
jgi:hypothetical protein